MLISNLIVDEIADPGRQLVVRSLILQLGEPRWVTSRRHEGGHAIGPVAILNTNERDAEYPPVATTAFPPRPLTGGPEQQRGAPVTFRDRWTIPSDMRGGTLYALVLPRDWIAIDAELTYHARSDWSPPPLTLGASSDSRLFYHTYFSPVQIWLGSDSFQWSEHVFDIKSVLECNPDRFAHMLGNSDALSGREGFETLGREISRSIGSEAKSATFWMKVVDLMVKVLGA